MEATLSNTESFAAAASVTDVSSFFLFEASADSESVLGDRDSASLADDDAESCSWDSGDQWPSTNFGSEDEESRSVVDDRSIGDRRFDREEADRSYRDDDQLWNDNGGEIGRPRIDRQKSSVSVESTTKEFESLSEVEKNRLFWEACLAS